MGMELMPSQLAILRQLFSNLSQEQKTEILAWTRSSAKSAKISRISAKSADEVAHNCKIDKARFNLSKADSATGLRMARKRV